MDKDMHVFMMFNLYLTLYFALIRLKLKKNN